MIGVSMANAANYVLDPDVLKGAPGVNEEIIPIKQMVRYTTPDGRYVYASADHRYIFKGDFKDQWTGETIGDFSKTNRIDWSYLNIQLSEHVVPIIKGSAPYTLIFSPECPNCANLLNSLRSLPEIKEYGLQLFLVSNSTKGMVINKNIWCATDPLEAIDFHIFGKDSNPQSRPDCSVAKLAHNLVIANSYGMRGLPILVAATGEAWIGKIDDAEKLKEIFNEAL